MIELESRGETQRLVVDLLLLLLEGAAVVGDGGVVQGQVDQEEEREAHGHAQQEALLAGSQPELHDVVHAAHGELPGCGGKKLASVIRRKVGNMNGK
jgi:hypothetical protein